MKRLLFVAASFAALTFAGPARADATGSDARAVKLANDVLRQLGGRERWDALTGLRWSFGVATHDTVRSLRRHAWNKHTGEHRVEGKTRTGDAFVIIHTLGDSTRGAAWVNGNAIEGDSLHKLIKRAEALWVNDSYWFLMPYKLLDPGVHLAWDSEVKDDLGTFDRISMTFANVGLTPGDHYWVDVNRRSHRVERWQMVLQGSQPPPVKYTWEGWEEHEGLWFPTAHRQDALNIFTKDVEAVREFPANTFRAP